MKIITVTLAPSYDRSIILTSTLKKGGFNMIKSSTCQPGGKGVNCSRTINVLGGKTTPYIICGGENGERLEMQLREEKISPVIIKSKYNTRACIKVLDSEGNCTTIDEEPISCEEEADAMIKKIMEDIEAKGVPEYILLCGSIPKGIAPDTYRKWITLFRNIGSKVYLDAKGVALREGIKASPALIKPNINEFCEFIGRITFDKKEIMYECQKIYKQYGTEVLCSLGDKGAVFVGADGNYLVQVPEIFQQSFAGAGDCLLSAFTYSKSLGSNTETALQFASAAACAKIALERSFPSYAEAAKYYSKIILRKL